MVGFELKSAEMDRGVGSYCFETSEANIDAAMLGAFCDILCVCVGAVIVV